MGRVEVWVSGYQPPDDDPVQVESREVKRQTSVLCMAYTLSFFFCCSSSSSSRPMMLVFCSGSGQHSSTVMEDVRPEQVGGYQVRIGQQVS